MYSLHLRCSAGDVDLLSGDLWEAGTAGVHEIDLGDAVLLIAGFEANDLRSELLARFAAYSPEWDQEDAIDWVEETYRAWPAREVGRRLFLAPPWSKEVTPIGRERIVHNPGLACGTGEHPCTQLALLALEEHLRPGSRVVDIGTGSGLLAIAALRLGAAWAIGIDRDEAALRAARENFELNRLSASLAAGSADCLASHCSDLTVANISGTVLLSIANDLLRMARKGAWLILTGFTEAELPIIKQTFGTGTVTTLNEWRCLSLLLS